MSKRDAIFIYNHEQLPYEFSKEHPFSPLRQVLTVDLLRSLGAISDDDMIHSKSASDEQICLFHDHSFMEAVKHAGTESLGNGSLEKYGLGTEDTPVFKDMHLAASNLVGGTIRAAHEVMEGRVLHAAHLGGGLHHGFRGKASGFCIYNDTAIAIRYLRERYDVKVLYIDTDAHHGDGVQWAFYDDPNVMTLSIHELGVICSLVLEQSRKKAMVKVTGSHSTFQSMLSLKMNRLFIVMKRRYEKLVDSLSQI